MEKLRITTSRRRTRGAIFVEACIVIASFVLLFLSMAFFRNAYLRKIQTMRLARATVIAYSMKGCPTGEDPAQWASVDLDPKAAKNAPGPSSDTTTVPPTEKSHSNRADSIMSEVPGAGSNGSQLDPIAELGFSMRAAATTKSGTLGTRKGYGITMSSTSYVTCAEGIQSDDFKGIIHYALDRFKLSRSSCSGSGKGCNPSDEN
jgi:hypothetical protein